ncbi:choice-of-anchor D domain-containing protein [Blastopirellula sp. J2-11]|nr:choice-of-anchor D domain-containing protein [Blastopirellula sp. J2-11]
MPTFWVELESNPGVQLVDYETIDFGTTPAGLPVAKKFIIINKGYGRDLWWDTRQSPAGFRTIERGGPDFDPENDYWVIVPPGQSSYLKVELTAEFEGEFGFSGNRLVFTSNDQVNSIEHLSLTGIVTGTPELEVFDDEVDGNLITNTPAVTEVSVGSVDIGGEIRRTFRIENAGTANLDLNSVVLGGAGEFAIDTSSLLYELGDLDGDGHTDVIATYFEAILNATNPGIHTNTITIQSNDTDENPFVFEITGEVVAPDLSIAIQESKNTAYENGENSKITVTRTSSGSLENTPALSFELSFTGDAESSDYSLIPSTYEIPAGEASVTIEIEATNDALWEDLETLSITLAEASSGQYEIDTANDTVDVYIQDNDEWGVGVTNDEDADEAGPVPANFLFTRKQSSDPDLTNPLTIDFWLETSWIAKTSGELAADFSLEGLDGNLTYNEQDERWEGKITIAADKSTQFLVVNPVSDDDIEPNDVITVGIIAKDEIASKNQPNYYVVADVNNDSMTDDEASLTIIDDTRPKVWFETASGVTVKENESTSLTVYRSMAGIESPLTIYIEGLFDNPANGQAKYAYDYSIGAENGSNKLEVTFPANEDELAITLEAFVDIFDDEGDETAELKLVNDSSGNPSYAVKSGYETANVTIEDVAYSSDNSDVPDVCQCTCAPGQCLVSDVTGDVQTLDPSSGLSYESEANADQNVVSNDVQIDEVSSTSNYLRATISFEGQQIENYYSLADFQAEASYRFAAPINSTGLSSGSYGWSMQIAEVTSSGSVVSVLRDVNGTKELVKNESTELGAGWRQNEAERLVVSNGRILWQRNGGVYEFFPDANGDYSRPEGEYGYTVITPVSGEAWKYVITMANGDQYKFEESGLLIEAESRVGNVTQYAYKQGTSVLESITDYRGRMKSFVFDSVTGLLTAITDFTGITTTYEYVGSQLSKVTQLDPDGVAGPLTTLETNYGYDALGRLQTIVSPNGGETIFYDDYGKVARIERLDGSVTTYQSWITAGLVDSAAGLVGTLANAAPLARTDLIYAEVTEKVSDTRSVTRKMQYDSFGRVIREIDGEGNVATYNRLETEAGRTITVTLPDPDGPGLSNESSYTSIYDYDTHGNLLKITYPDQSTEVWEYDLTFNEATKYINQLGATTLYTLDPVTGRKISERLIVGDDDTQPNVNETNDLVMTYTYTPGGSGEAAPAGLIDLVTMVSSSGNRVTDYDYNADGNVTQITYAKGTANEASVSFEYTENEGYLSTVTDELGNQTLYSYDDLGRQTEVILPDPDDGGPLSAPVMRYVYDSKGQMVEEIETDAVNSVTRSTQYVYDLHGRITQEKRPDHDGDGKLSIATYEYFANGWLRSMTDAEDRVTSYEYDDNGRVISVTLPDPDGDGLDLPTYSYAYDGMGRQTVEIDPHGHITATGYGDWGKAVYTAEGTLLADPEGMKFFREYAAATTDNGQLSAMIRQIGSGYGTMRLSSNYYDSTGQFLHDGYEFREYSGLSLTLLTNVNNGDPASVVRPTSTIYEYDELGRVTRTLSPEYDFEGETRRSETTYDYNEFGELVAIHETADGVTRTTMYQYDARGRQIAVLSPDPDGSQPQQMFAYDDAGRLISETISGILPGDATPTSYTTSYSYDHLGRVVKTTMPDPGSGAPEHLTQYDAFGRVIAETDPLDQVTYYQYDLHDNLVRTVSPDPDGAGGPELSLETVAFYNDLGWRMSTTLRPLGAAGQDRTTTYGYDGLGRTTSVTYPEPDPGSPGSPVVVEYDYDLVGNLLNQADANGNITTYAYDEYDQMTKMTTPDPDGVGPESARVYNFSYDARGRTTYGYDAQGRRVYYIYDGRNNLLEERQTVDPDTSDAIPAPSTFYVYDGFDRMVSMTDPAGNETQYVFDTLDRLTSMINAEQGISEYTYDFRGNRLTLSDPEENVTTWEYDALGRVVAETNPLSDVRSYQYDVGSNLTQYVDRNGRVIMYDYDDRNRLRSETWYASQGGAIVDQLQFDYDAFGQLTSASDSDSTLAFAYDNLGRQVDFVQTHGGKSYDVGQTFDSVGNRLTYDAAFDGNSDAQRQFTYDGRNRLTSVQETGVSVEKRVDFSYNVNNQFTSIDRYEDLTASDLAMQSTYSYDALLRLTELLTTTADSSDLPQVPPEGEDPAESTTMTITPFGSTTAIADDTGTFTYTATAETRSRTQAFVITNTGANDLQLGDISLPTGYSLAKDFDVDVLAPGEKLTFAVRLDAATDGTFGGDISFDTNGAVDGTFNFAISGEVLPITETIVVNSTRDLADSNSGDGIAWTGQNNSAGVAEVTLRAAIEYANASAGIQQILFDIPATEAGWNGTWFHIDTASVLPTLTDTTLIVGQSQEEFVDPPVIELRSVSSSSFNGLNIATGAGGSVISGLSITNFVGDGVSISTSDIHLHGSYIGVNPSGSSNGNNRAGVAIYAGSGNLIGTDADGSNDLMERNVISGNAREGILLSGDNVNGNVIAGNFVGTGVDGLAALGNTRSGVLINAGADRNIVGDMGDGLDVSVRRNIISGNVLNAVAITNIDSDFNRISGNYLGVNAAGNAAIANSRGVWISTEAKSNIIGTNGDGIGDQLEGNVISGNSNDGVYLASSSAYNSISGNKIGTDASGTVAIANGSNGVIILSGSHHNLVGTNSGDGLYNAMEGNLISGNQNCGIIIRGSSENWISGNRIGTDSTGAIALSNGNYGVVLDTASTNNIVGTNGDGVSDDGEANVISGNGAPGSNVSGVFLNSTGTTNNIVAGNLIGTDATGTYAVPNAKYGVWIYGGAQNNIIGTNGNGVGDAAERNIISGNGSVGVRLEGSVPGNRIAGNYIGTDISGSYAVANVNTGVNTNGAVGTNYIGTNSDGVSDSLERNLISGNGAGIYLDATSSFIIAGNWIGLDAVGDPTIGNTGKGVWIDDSSSNNRIGSNMDGVRDDDEANWIGGNGGDGVAVTSSGSTGNLIRRNRIFKNGGLAIDLADNGVTNNDTFDWDSGPNALQNFPTISSVGASSVSGSLSSSGSRTFYLDLYGGYRPGDASAYLGSVAVSTNFFGSTNYTINANLYDYSYFVVTATDSTNNNTSEFSAFTGNSPVINTGSGNAYSHDTIAWDSSSPTKSLTLANYGGSAFTVSSVTVDNPNFTLGSVLTGSYGASATDAFTITAAAGLVQDQSGTLTITLNTGKTFVYNLRYNAPDSEIALTLDGSELAVDAEIDFGDSPEGNFVTKTLVINNPSANPLYLSDFAVTGDFILLGAGELTSIAAGQSANIQVQVASIYPGSYLGQLSFTTSDEDETSFLISLTGTIVGNGDGQSVIDQNDYEYDYADRLTGWDSLVFGVQDFTYDDTNQLTDIDREGADQTFTYDENGNRISGAYVIGPNNQILSNGVYNYQYDAEGNRIRRTEIATGAYLLYSWDHRNRLIGITEKDSLDTTLKTVVYAYDALGRRIAKEIDANGDGDLADAGDSEERYYHDGQQIALRTDGDGTILNRYLYGPNIDQVIADEDAVAGDVLWAATDHLGSVRHLADYDEVTKDVTIANSIDYDAFGNIVSETNAAIDHIYAYTGRDRDKESDLQYNRARYYDAELGRWMSQDPIGFAAGDANLYRYVGNSHLNAVDPSGLLPGANRGEWISGTPGNGVFRYNNSEWAQNARVAGAEVVFKDGHIAEGGFPAEWYYGGSAEKGSVPIRKITGTDADFTAADEAMREKLKDPNWKRPKGYTWNHAGTESCKTMELVESGKGVKHGAVSHKGSGAAARARLRAAKIAPKAFGALTAYFVVRDAADFARGHSLSDVHEDYVFSDGESEYTLTTRSPLGYILSYKYMKNYISGPREGESEYISDEVFEEHRQKGIEMYGRLRWNPWTGYYYDEGDVRKGIPVKDEYGREIGFCGKDGIEYYEKGSSTWIRGGNDMG